MCVHDVWSYIFMPYHTRPHGLPFRLGVYIIHYSWLIYSVSCHEFTQQYLLLNSRVTAHVRLVCIRIKAIRRA